mmetsp:Transcript_142605/g.397337  ORF Transcript_142605/g.397337 Transcript_142605/m.397337 type:complete len:137 (+) Transcript_142605:115-525(+)
MRIAVPPTWLLPRPAGVLAVVELSRQVPALAWLRVVIFALLAAFVIMALGYVAWRLFERLQPQPEGGEDAAGSTLLAGGRGQGNLLQTCGVCQQVHPMEALIPCGHMLCGTCRAQVSLRCPFCRAAVEACQPVFQP